MEHSPKEIILLFSYSYFLEGAHIEEDILLFHGVCTLEVVNTSIFYHLFDYSNESGYLQNIICMHASCGPLAILGMVVMEHEHILPCQELFYVYCCASTLEGTLYMDQFSIFTW
jgi:hypothetical protein